MADDEPQWVQGPDGRWWPVQQEQKKDSGCGTMILILLITPITLVFIVWLIGVFSR